MHYTSCPNCNTKIHFDDALEIIPDLNGQQIFSNQWKPSSNKSIRQKTIQYINAYAKYKCNKCMCEFSKKSLTYSCKPQLTGEEFNAKICKVCDESGKIRGKTINSHRIGKYNYNKLSVIIDCKYCDGKGWYAK